MKILTAAQIREADAQTILEEQIPSVDLMERAAAAFTDWFISKFPNQQHTVLICCGPGNNGGDGLAIARLLHITQYPVTVWIVAPEARYSSDFKINRQRLPATIPVITVTENTPLPEINNIDFIIDGLFGSGLSRPVTGIFAEVIQQINQAPATKIAIDIPSGLYTEKPNDAADAIVQANYTVSFELPKLAFLLPQNESFVGEWHIVPIGLSPKYLNEAVTPNYIITPNMVKNIVKPRGKFSHKGTYGHALLLAGSYGKMGAAVLAARACLRSGVGLLTVNCPRVGYAIMQISAPEAMTLPDAGEHFLTDELELDITNYQAIGIGPGLGKATETKRRVAHILRTAKVPLVLDADALNSIAEDEELLTLLPPGSILTPHPKEFERLTGKAQNDYHRLELLQRFCRQHHCYVVLKGGHTCIGTPEGKLYFNLTGNPGMATGGSGDVLTGILTALVAQKYTPLKACLLGVYTHGLAGDYAKEEKGEMALVASDIIENLGKAFSQNQ